jgi:hypothetical protein
MILEMNRWKDERKGPGEQRRRLCESRGGSAGQAGIPGLRNTSKLDKRICGLGLSLSEIVIDD